MIGTLINASAILLCTLLGLMLRKGIPERVRATVVMGQALCVMLIGLSNALKTADIIGVILCMVIGSLIGALLDIEGKLNGLGSAIERRFFPGGAQGSVAKGFVTASLVFCVGAMAITGAMDSGLNGDHSTLIAKSVLDGVFTIFFTSSLGVGVGLSAFSVLVYQGSIALMASWLKPLLTAAITTEMSAVGGLLILALGLNMIYEDRRIPVGNMLPAIFLPALYLPLTSLFA